MNKIILLFGCVFISICAYGQEVRELYLETFPAIEINHVEVHSMYGKIQLEPSNNEIAAEVKYIFNERVFDKAEKLLKGISIVHEIRSDSLFLTTKLDDRLFMKNNLIWEVIQDAVIDFTLYVPAHVSIRAQQTQGQVFVPGIDNKVHATLSSAALFAKRSKQVAVHGSDFLIEANNVEHLEVKGSHGYLILSNSIKADLDLEYSSVESHGFKVLNAQLSNCSISSGLSNIVHVTASKSAVEFTDVLEEGTFDMEDVLFAVQKLPPKMRLQSRRGENRLMLSNKRHANLSLVEEDSLTHLKLRNGTFHMEYKRKKAAISSDGIEIKKGKSFELNQSGEFGLRAVIDMLRGSLLIDK